MAEAEESKNPQQPQRDSTEPKSAERTVAQANETSDLHRGARPDAQHPDQHPEHSPKRLPKIGANYITAFATVGILVANVWFAVFALGQLNAMKAQANASARALQDNESVQRANVVFVNTSVTHSGHQINVSATIKNVGQTNATQVRLAAVIQTFMYGRDSIVPVGDRLDYAYSHLPASVTSASVGLFTPNFQVTQTGSYPNVDDAEWETMKRMPDGWVYVGRLTYRDIFGHDRWATFCTYQAGNDTALFCPEHNEEGEGQPP